MRVRTMAVLAMALLLVVAAPGLAAADDEASAGDEMNGGNATHLEAIVGAFAADAAELAAAHDEGGIGYGALFKLALYGAVKGMTLTEVLGLPTDAEGSYSFGELFGGLSEGEEALLEDMPENFGQLVAAAHRPAHAGPMDQADRDALKDARQAAKQAEKDARKGAASDADGSE